jgi:hypothetical protein
MSQNEEVFTEEERRELAVKTVNRLIAASVNLIWPLLIFSFGPTPW